MKQFFFLLMVLVSFQLSAQNKSDKAPNGGSMKKEATITTAPTAVAAPAAAPAPSAEPAVERTNAKMTFESLTVDYGTIENGAEPLRLIKFTNTGTDPLVIKNARGSCGCTVPTWPRDPIAPGQSATMEVRYDTKRTGQINKSITITTNEGPENHVIQVVGNVLAPKEDKAVPAAEPNIIKGN
jgi:hypothetical protein